MEQNFDTKARILESARSLFAERGFEGASIRDIAKIAGVNIASVNYHFNNKETLFCSILNDSYKRTADSIKQIAEKWQSVEETFLDIFRYFINNSETTLNHFKMLMSPRSGLFVPMDSQGGCCYGPPGATEIEKIIAQEVDSKVSEKDMLWATGVLYAHIGHMVIIYSCFLKEHPQTPYSSISDIEWGFRRLIKMVMSELVSKSVKE